MTIENILADPILALSVALSFETYQYFLWDERELKLKDRALDTSFYVIGASGVPAPYLEMEEDGPFPWQWN